MNFFRRLSSTKKFLLICLLLIWIIFGYSRHQGLYTTYIPLTWRVFDINPSDITSITVVQYLPKDNELKSLTYKTPEELFAITETLNHIHYSFWIPQLPDLFQIGGGSTDDYWILIQSNTSSEPIRFDISGPYIYAKNIKYCIGLNNVNTIVFDIENPS